MKKEQFKRTFLYQQHITLNAKMVEFAGFMMPVSFEGILAEQQAVRLRAGLFDLGHMGVVDVSGKEALAFLELVATNCASKLEPLHSQYSILCNESGGVVDDILVYRLLDGYRLVLNAANTDKDLKWLIKLAASFKDVKIVHRQEICMLSLQGPDSQKTLNEVSGLDFSHLKKNQCEFWDKYMVSRTGYTGEDGFEFFLPKEAALKLWETFVSKGVKPCGLGARDLLRIEAGYPLYGHEYNENITPLEAGYGWVVHFEKEKFIGKEALLKQKKEGLRQRLVGLKIKGQAVPRQGFKIYKEGELAGEVTSGTFSPVLKSPIALAYVRPDIKEGARVIVKIRENDFEAQVVDKNSLRR